MLIIYESNLLNLKFRLKQVFLGLEVLLAYIEDVYLVAQAPSENLRIRLRVFPGWPVVGQVRVSFEDFCAAVALESLCKVGPFHAIVLLWPKLSLGYR